MSPDRFRDCLAALRWSQRGLAEMLATHTTTVRRWATGDAIIPSNVAQWLEELAGLHHARPLPSGWCAKPPGDSLAANRSRQGC